MEKTQARRRKQRRRKVKMAEAWTLVFLMELFVAAIPAGIAAAVFVARELRGYAAVDGEWLLVALIFCGAYCATHKWVCNKIFEEGKHE